MIQSSTPIVLVGDDADISEPTLERLLDRPTPVALLNIEGTICQVNVALRRLLRSDELHLLGSKITELDVPGWNPAQVDLQAHIEESRSGFSRHFTLPMALDGIRTSCDISLIPVMGDTQDVAYLILEIHAAPPRTAALRDPELLAVFVENMPTPVAMFDRKMRYLCASRSWFREFGIEGRDIIGKSHYEIFPEMLAAPKRLEYHQRSLQGEIISRERDRVVINGRELWIRFQLRPWHEASGEIGGIMFLAEDITESVNTRRDLEEMRRAQRELAGERWRMQVIGDAMSELVFFTDLQGRVVGCNEAYCRFFAVDRAEAIGRTPMELAQRFPLLAQRAPIKLARVLNDEKPYRHYETLENEGRRFRFETVLTRILDQDGQPSGVLGISRDITEQHQLSTRMRRQERGLNMALDAGGLGIMEWTAAEGGYWDARTYGILGLDPQRYPPSLRSILRIVHPDDRSNLSDELRRAWRALSEYRTLARIRRPDGEHRIVSFRGRVEKDGERPLLQAGVVADVSTQESLRRQLERQSERLDLAMRAAGLGTWIWRFDNQEFEIDARHALLVGLPESGRTAVDGLLQQVHVEDRERVEAEFMAARGEDRELSSVFRAQHLDDGRERVIECIGRVVNDDDGAATMMVGVSRDITAQFLYQKDLEEARDAAETAARAKTRFLANMSHEIRTPINAIMGFAQLLARSTRLSSSESDQLDTIRKSADHLLALVNDILDISRVESGMVSLHEADFDLRQMLVSLQRMFSLRLQQTPVAMHIELNDHEHILRGDEGKIRQILINLLNNAVKFTHQGEIVLAARTRAADGGGLLLELTVRDTGSGIDPRDLPHIFGEFNQARNAETGEGTGLGLSICRQLAQLMGGSITAESTLNAGSSFRVELKVAPGSGMGLTAGAPFARLASGGRRSRPRALVISALPAERRQLVELLAATGFDTQEASGAREVWDGIDQWQADVLLLDMEMAQPSPYQLIAHMRAGHHRPVPIIGLSTRPSGEQSPEDDHDGTGPECWLVRPLVEQALFKALEQVGDFSFVQELPPTLEPEDSTEQPHTGADLPTDLVRKLSTAAEAADLDTLLDLVNAVRPLLPELAGALESRIHRMDYEGIFQLLSPDGGPAADRFQR